VHGLGEGKGGRERGERERGVKKKRTDRQIETKGERGVCLIIEFLSLAPPLA